MHSIIKKFENELRSGRQIAIEQVLDGLPKSDTENVLGDLIEVEIRHRFMSGETPLPSDYSRFGSGWAVFAATAISRLKKPNAEVSEFGMGESFGGTIGLSGTIADSKTWPTPASSTSKIPSGTIVDQYRIIREVGQGGMGEVYLAHHKRFKTRAYAIKFVKAGVMDEATKRRFIAEIEVMAELNHENIVYAADAGLYQDRDYLVMEYVNGFDLKKIVNINQQLSVGAAADIIRQAAMGLQHANIHQLVHRDIKPSNLMLSKNGVLKILDLGLARDRQSDSEITQTFQIMGTPDYMAPEQWHNTKSVDIRADIYSLGCTLYCLLAGVPPFSGDDYPTYPSKMKGHIFEEPADIQGLASTHVPTELSAILTRMLAKKPEDRFQDPREIADALAPFSVSEEVQEIAQAIPVIDLNAEINGANTIVFEGSVEEGDYGETRTSSGKTQSETASVLDSLRKISNLSPADFPNSNSFDIQEWASKHSLLSLVRVAKNSQVLNGSRKAFKVRFGASKDKHHPSREIVGFRTSEFKIGEDEVSIVRFSTPAFGSFGHSGILPNADWDLIASRRNDGLLSDFLNVFNHRQIENYYFAWEKNRIDIRKERVERLADQDSKDRQPTDIGKDILLAISGIGLKELKGKHPFDDSVFARFAMYFARPVRSTNGVVRSLKALFGLNAVTREFAMEKLTLPVSERTQIGVTGQHRQLGKTAIVGRFTKSYTRFEIKIGPLTKTQFERFCYSGIEKNQFKQLVEFLKAYCGATADFSIRYLVHRTAVRRAQLGRISDLKSKTTSAENQNSRTQLGVNSWVLIGDSKRNRSDPVYRSYGNKGIDADIGPKTL